MGEEFLLFQKFVEFFFGQIKPPVFGLAENALPGKDLDGIRFIVSRLHESFHETVGFQSQFFHGLSVFFGQRTVTPEYPDNLRHGSLEHKSR
jgi:hypothetical protein